MDVLNITIVGGGNIGTQFAVHCAEKKHDVTIYTSKADKFNSELTITNEKNEITNKAYIKRATNNPKDAFENSDIIFVTVPAFMMKETADTIEPFFKEGLYIGLIPGTGGGECCFKKAIEKGCIVFGLQRVPSVARLKEYGKTVCASGYRDTLHVAAIPNKETINCCKIIKSIFNFMKVISLPNYLCVTMTPSNPVLHTSRLCSLFSDYTNGKIYDYIPLFYEEWSLDSSELLLKNDEEVQNICKALNDFNLQDVKSLKIHYESENAAQLTNKMRSIKSLQGLATPSIKLEEGFIPDFNSRYFTADFPFGLEILVQIGNFAGVEIPNLKATLKWYWDIVHEGKRFYYKNFGINSKEDFLKFYKK